MNKVKDMESFDLEFKLITPVSSFFYNSYFLRMIPNLIILILKNKILGFSFKNNQVFDRYNEGPYKKVFELKSWKDTNNIHDFIFPKSSIPMYESKKYMILDNKLCSVSDEEFYRYRPIPLLKILSEYTNSNETIVELGCGWGRNLFYLAALNFKNNLEGYELTEKGISSAQEINNFFNCGIKFEQLDLTKNYDSINIKGKIVFTQKVMEQLKYDTEKVIQNIIKAKPKEVIHIEPISELYTNKIRDIASKLYIKAADYQDNLLTTLKKFESQGKIKIIEVRRLKFAANPWHEDTLIRWIPTNSSI